MAEESPKVAAWIASDSPYRPAFVFPGVPKTTSKGEEPWKELDQATVDAWRARDMTNRWATSDRTARALAWLEQEFGRR